MRRSLRMLLLVLMLIVGGAAPSQVRGAAPAAGPPPAAPAAATCPQPLDPVGSPNNSGANVINSLAAAAPDDIWGVGAYSGIGIFKPLAEHWNGTDWTQVSTPALTATATLAGAAATAGNDVWAVGALGRHLEPTITDPLVEHWNGQAWTQVASPIPTSPYYYGALNGVAALAADDAWAVGSYITGPLTPTAQSLIAHWNGTQWSVMTGLTDTVQGRLNAVTAINASDVWAVGTDNSTTATQPLVIHWDGTAWSRVPTPQLVNGGTLNAISAQDPDDIWAAGTDFMNTASLILHWNGTQWTQASVPNPRTPAPLLGLAVFAPDDAWAVGYFGDTGNTHPLVLHWDGQSWQLGFAPAVDTGSLHAAVNAAGVDFWVAGEQKQMTLIARRAGSNWDYTPSPSPAIAFDYLSDVSAVNGSDIWAVGSYSVYPDGNRPQYTALAQHWDGTQWTQVPTPLFTPYYELFDELYAVDAIATDNVWAVGDTNDNGGDYGGLIEHWNGQHWEVVDRETPGTRSTFLRDVASTSASDVWAVGQFAAVETIPEETRIDHFDGNTWQTVSSPNAAGDNVLYGVTAIAPDDAWAGGSSTGSGQPLLMHWNGSAWSIVPGPAGVSGTITSLAATASNDVWAVGSSGSGASARALFLHWDGTAWSQVAGPSIAGFGWLNRVEARAADDVWDVGYTTSGQTSQALALRWDGYAWRVVRTANPGTLTDNLTGVAPLGPDGVWIVGTSDNPTEPTRTLIEHSYPANFSDVYPNDYYFTPVNYLVAAGAISGYGDCTFRPFNNTTRAQLTKIIVIAMGWPLITPRDPHFSDVPTSSPFYSYVETAYAHGIIAGYGDGGFRPNFPVTRGQTSKIIVGALGWTLMTPATPHFSDVPSSNPFYSFIETAYAHNIIAGYGDGTFHPNSNVTRGQLSKMAYLAITTP